MTTDRMFTHPNLGRECRVEWLGNEVALVFVCHDEARAEQLAKDLLRQLREGGVNLTLMGKT